MWDVGLKMHRSECHWFELVYDFAPKFSIKGSKFNMQWSIKFAQ